LISLRAPEFDEEPFFFEAQIRNLERDEFGESQRPGPADEQQRPIAQPEHIVWCSGDHARESLEAERCTLALGNAELTPGSPDDRPHDVMLSRILYPAEWW